MRPTSLPVGPLGWTTFWTLARIVRFVSENTLTVIRRTPGEARAVPSRRTLRIGSGRRYRFRPHGAFAKVRMDFDGIELFPQSPQVPSFEGEDPRAVLDGFPGDITVPMYTRPLRSFVDLFLRPSQRNLGQCVLDSQECKRGNENDPSLSLTLKMLAKPL